MKLLHIFCFLLFFIGCTAQKKIYYDKEIKAIQNIQTMPYSPELSGDSLFWNITIKKKEIIPALIEHIDDTLTTSANVPNFGGVYTIGDVCVRAIEEIINGFPTIKIIEKNEFVINEKAYGIYWDFVRSSFQNRQDFKIKVKQWYEKNKDSLVWVTDERLYAVSDDEGVPAKKRPSGGYYIIKEK
jgi:hypothetical protein